MAETIYRPGRPQASEPLPEDAHRVLDWLRQRQGPGRARIFSAIEVARGVFGRAEGPMPGVMFDPALWPRVKQALALLEQRGLVERAQLPQGDLGYRLASPES
ncbi:MAG: hypothetical protein HY690_19915 [Chloroflexi bacterium]|nr:hypothetical protein [Chloroflexota bacterium]